MMVLLGGPLHGILRWVNQFQEFFSPEDAEHKSLTYRFAFGDDHVGIYYWKINDSQVKAVRQQITQLQIHHGENLPQ